MSEQVGIEPYSEVVRCDHLHGSRPCRFRAGQERELESEAWEAPVLPLYDARSCINILVRIDLAHSGSSNGLPPWPTSLLRKARFPSKCASSAYI